MENTAIFSVLPEIDFGIASESGCLNSCQMTEMLGAMNKNSSFDQYSGLRLYISRFMRAFRRAKEGPGDATGTEGATIAYNSSSEDLLSKDIRDLFDSDEYLRQNPDVAQSGLDPVFHYLNHGVYEGRTPPAGFSEARLRAIPGGSAIADLMISSGFSAPATVRGVFDAAAYLSMHSDVAKVGMEPLMHYLRHGFVEGRRPPPDFHSRLLQLAKGGDKEAVRFRDQLRQLLSQAKNAYFELDNDAISDNLGVGVLFTSAHSLALGVVLYNNTEEEIRRLLRSASKSLELEGQSFKFYMINNGDPLSSTMNKLLQSFQVILLENTDGNLGSSAGHSRLMKAAFTTSDCIGYLTLNPDGFFHPKCLARMLKMAVCHEWNSAIEAAQLPLENSKYYDPETFETGWAVTACALFPRKIWEQIGGFDPHIFLYCDDVDYGWQIRHAGFSVKYCPWAYYFHDFAPRTAVSEFFQRNRLEAGRYLAHKWSSPDFRVFCEKELIRLGHFGSTANMAAIDHLPQISTGHNVADFKHQFYFAPNRW